MKLLGVYLFIISAGAVLSFPADPNREVEFVQPENTNNRDPETGVSQDEIPVIVIRRRPVFSFGTPTDFGSFFDRNSGFGDNFPFDNFPFGGGFPFENRDETVGADKTGEDETGVPCGFLCRILTELQQHIDQLEGDVRRVQHEHENKTISESDNGYDVYNETYTERTLPDGTVVKINQTVIADTSNDGSSFFFHKTSFHQPGSDYEEDEEAEIETEFSPTDSSSSSTTQILGIVPSIDQTDESINEVVDETKEANKGIDEGLLAGIQ